MRKTLLFSILSLLLGLTSLKQETASGAEWYWYDEEGNQRTRAAIDTVLQNHKVWVEELINLVQEYKQDYGGYDSTLSRFIRLINWKGGIATGDSVLQARLDNLGNDTRRADFSHAILTGVRFNGSELTDAIFKDAKLDRAQFMFANLPYADFTSAELDSANFMWAELTKSTFKYARLKNANLGGTNLTDALIEKACLENSILHAANLTDASMRKSNLTSALLQDAVMNNTDLYKANLSQTIFLGANLNRVVFIPEVLPRAIDIAYAVNLDRLRYFGNPAPLVQLKQAFWDEGFKIQSKKINTALQRGDASCLETIIFDYTCEWGANYVLPLIFIFSLFIISGTIYGGLLEVWQSESGKYLIASKKELEIEIQKNPKKWLKVKGGWKEYGLAWFFALERSLRVGFRDFSPKQWLLMLAPRDFDIESRGWPRVVSGIQSLLSIIFIVLSLLSYFSRPFEF